MSKILLSVLLLAKNLTEYMYFDQDTDKAFFLDLGSFCKYYLDSAIIEYMFKYSHRFRYGYFEMFNQFWFVYICDCILMVLKIKLKIHISCIEYVLLCMKKAVSTHISIYLQTRLKNIYLCIQTYIVIYKKA